MTRWIDATLLERLMIQTHEGGPLYFLEAPDNVAGENIQMCFHDGDSFRAEPEMDLRTAFII